MKCNCPSCKKTILVPDNQLRAADKPIFKCPNCSSIIKVRPSEAKCGNCNYGFAYYDYKFEKEMPYVRCTKCATVNKIPLNY